nr:RNA polymerase beta subunit [Chloroidium sp. KL-2023a]
MDGSLLTPFGVQQSEGVNEDFSGPSLANFSFPIKKSSLFSRANLWKIRESLCFYTRDKGKRIPLWELQINSRQTPFRYFIPRLLLTERHGLLSKAWARNRTHLKSNAGNHAVGQLFPTKGGLWTSPSLDYREPTRTILEKHEIFSILCTTERSVKKKSVPVAGFAFLKPTYSSLVLAGLNPLGGCTELRSSNFASRECGKCTKGQLLLVFSKAEQEVEYGSKRVITSRSNSVPTFGKLSLNESYRLISEAEHAKVGKKLPRDQALNPTSGGARNSGATIRRVSIYDQIRCHLVRRLRKNVLVGPGLSLRQFELRLLHPWKSQRISKKGYILFCSTPITKSYTIHNQTAQKIEDFTRLPIRASVHPKRFKKDATLELLGDSENRAKVVGPVVLAPFGGNPNYGAAKNPPLGVSKNESKPTRFAKAISLKRDSKHLGLPEQSIARNFRRGLPTANQRPLWPRGGPVTQTKAVSLNRIFKQASELFSTKPINGALREFFGINPLSQYMDQTNPLAELTHKRRISSLGIGGVSRESAGMAIRGIHPTHYGRICPIETPEGKNAGLVNSLALYARLNKHGFIETPYYKVIKGQVQEELGFSFYSALKETVDRLHLAPSDLQQSQANMLGHLSLGSLLLRCSKLSEAEQASESSLDRAVTKKQICQGPASGRFMTTQTAASTTGAIHYPKFRLPLKGVQLADEFGEASAGCLVPVRVADTLLDVFKKVTPYEVDCIGISPVQILSVATSLIPFLEHNDANRALMGSNMQRQAVPLMISERPIVGTGLETLIAAESGQVIQSSISGLVSHVSANKIIIERLFNTGPKDGLDQPSTIFLRTFPNRPRSKKMDGSLLLTQVEHGILADTSGTKDVSCSTKLSMQRRANTSRTKEFLAPYGGNLSEVPATEPLTFATQKWERAELLANFRYAQGCPRRGHPFASLLLRKREAETTFRLPPKGAKKDAVLSEAERARKSCPNIFLQRRPFAKAKLSFAETKAIKLSYLITSRRNDSLLCLQWTTPQIWLYSILRTCAIKPSPDWTTRSTSNRAYPICQSLASFRALIARRSMSKNAPSTVSRRRLPHEFITPFLLTRGVSKKKVERSESFRFSEIDFVKASRALSALRSVIDSPTSKLQTVTLLPPSVTLTPRTLAGLPFACSASLSYIHLRKSKQKVKFANRNFVSGFRSALLTFAKQKCAKRSFASKREAKAWRSAPRQFSPAFTGPYVVCQELEGRFFSRADLLLTNFRLRFAEQSIAHGVPLEPLWFAKQTLECAHPFVPTGRTTDLRKLPIRTSVDFAKQSLRKYVPGRATLELSKMSFGRARINHKSVSSAGYRSLCAQTLLRKSTWFCVSKYKKPKNHVLFSELSQLYKNKVQQSQYKLSVFGLLSAPDPVLLNLRLSVGLNPLCGCTEVQSGNLAERKLLRSEGFGAKLLLEWLTRSELAIKRPSVVESTTPKGLIIKRQPKVAVESPDNRARSIGKRAPRSRFAETSQQMTLFPFVHSLRSFSRSNQETCLTQKPLIQEGEWVQKGDVLTDCSASEKGELAVGKNVMIAYLPWEGYNFEDAIVVSDRLTKEQIYASLHIERYVCEAQDIKEKITNSNEWFTRNLPGVNPKLVSHLDTFGFPKIGTILNEGDILVGKMRYFRNKPTTPYEKLLSDILGDGHFSVSLTSLRVPKGVHEARVISHRVVKTFRSSLENTFTGVSRPAGTPKMVNIFLGEKRSIQIGDKMSGRHGNKGIISTILPKQDMPYLPDGSPIDILLNPLGVPSRMNVGQIFESLLGLASTYLNQNFKITAFDELYGVEASQSLVYLKLYQARLQSGQNWLFQINFPGKTRLIDGRSGECFDQWVTVGRAYMLKLIHMVNEKIHARNTGPYALITQQPLRGRSQKGGQRLGEMEVWALEGYGAAYILQELLTKKSDDFAGRQEIINSLVVRSDKFSSPENPYREYSNPDDPYQRFSDPDNPYQVIQETRLVLGHPEIFKTLICELQALCLDVGVYALKKDSFQREYLGIVN